MENLTSGFRVTSVFCFNDFIYIMISSDFSHHFWNCFIKYFFYLESSNKVILVKELHVTVLSEQR